MVYYLLMDTIIKSYYDINGQLVQRSLYVPTFKHRPPINHDHLRSVYESRRRAFSLAQLKLLINPDMTYFVTLTYDPKKTTSPDYLNDLKNFFRGKHIKYIAVFEKHKHNPCFHIHLITSKIDTFKNKNGYLSVKGWCHGYSSVKTIKNFDDNFRVQRYIFKYMTKSVKLKHKWIYSSRGLLTKPTYRTITINKFAPFPLYLFGGLTVRRIMIQSKYTVIKAIKEATKYEEYHHQRHDL